MSDAETYDYERLKELADSEDRTFESVLALATSNDPYNANTPSRRRAARWFADIWKQFQIKPGMHDRRIHYLLVSQKTQILNIFGEPYENTERQWGLLCVAIRDARYLELIPPGAIVDRRNPEPAIYYASEGDTEPLIRCGEGGVIKSEISVTGPHFVRPWLTLEKPVISQPYHVELWCEKSTMNDVLMPLGHAYGVNIVTASGEMSSTACETLVNRAIESEKPVRILYISDFDPAGRAMPVSAARKIEFYIAKSGVPLDIQVRPVVLTHDQCVEFRLPRTPIKETERRGANFEARFGEGATELDALEAIRPGELERILVREIERYHDVTLNDRIEDVATEASRDLTMITVEVHRQFADEVAALDTLKAEIAAEAERMREHIAAREADFARQARPVFDAMAEELQARAPDVDDYEWPEADEAEEDDDPLFDSTRGYVEQIERYRAHQGKSAEDAMLGNRRQLTLTCQVCGGTFTATRPANACGSACRAKLFRDRQSGKR